MDVNPQDRTILRDLARRVAEAAAKPMMARRRERWRRHNRLEPVRPEIRCDEEATRGCVVEMILKDTHTCENRPERFTRWTAIARDLVERY